MGSLEPPTPPQAQITTDKEGSHLRLKHSNPRRTEPRVDAEAGPWEEAQEMDKARCQVLLLILIQHSGQTQAPEVPCWTLHIPWPWGTINQ